MVWSWSGWMLIGMVSPFPPGHGTLMRPICKLPPLFSNSTWNGNKHPLMISCNSHRWQLYTSVTKKNHLISAIMRLYACKNVSKNKNVSNIRTMCWKRYSSIVLIARYVCVNWNLHQLCLISYAHVAVAKQHKVNMSTELWRAKEPKHSQLILQCELSFVMLYHHQ